MIYKFNKYELNQELREVFFNGDTQVVQPKVFDLLVFLIQNRNRAVSKDEIQDSVWANLEITETAMTRAIMKARKVLSVDDQKDPYIKTIHGHGYRFMAKVQEFEHESMPPINVSSAIKKTKSKPLFGVLIIAFLCSLIAIGFMYSYQDNFTPDSRIAILPFINKTNNPEYSWTSKGLMGLSTEIIKAQNNVKTVSTSKLAKVETTNNSLSLSDQEVNDLKNSLQASHLVIVELLLQSTKEFNLNYVIYHPKGKQNVITLTGKNPTELSLMMSKNIIGMTTGSSLSHKKYRVISDKTFTNELYARGVALRLEGKAKQARDYFKLAMDEDSELFWPRYQYAITSRLIGLYDESITELTNILNEISTIASNDKDLTISILNALGSAYMHKADFKQGISYYEKAYNLAEEISNHDYAVKIATNIAWIYKSNKDYPQSRIWVSKSLQMLKTHNLPPLTNNLFLLAQLEERMNNFDKAESILNEAYTNYINENSLEYAAKVLRQLSHIKEKKGLLDKALELNKRSSSTFIELKRDVELLGNNITKVSFLIKQGRYSEAEKLNNENISQANDKNLRQRIQQARQHRFLLLFKQKKYQSALNEYKSLPEKDYHHPSQLDQFEAMAVKSEYALGNKQPLNQWLKEYKSLSQTGDINNDLTYDLMNIYVLEQEAKIQELKLTYREYIEKCRNRGFIAHVAKYLLKLSYLYNDTEHQTVVDLHNEIQLLNLDWWQIQLFEARIKLLDGKVEEAKQLAIQAKGQSTESWSDENQQLFESILGS